MNHSAAPLAGAFANKPKTDALAEEKAALVLSTTLYFSSKSPAALEVEVHAEDAIAPVVSAAREAAS
jgi:hypothetical protein